MKQQRFNKAIAAKVIHDKVLLGNPVFVVYTDGSGYWKTQLGGIGGYIQYKNKEQVLSTKSFRRGYFETTTQRMELRAIIEALQVILIKNQKTIIFTDSEYALNIISNKSQPIENLDLVKLTKQELALFSNINIYWITGHSNIEGNDRADKLADYKQFNHSSRIRDERN